MMHPVPRFQPNERQPLEFDEHTVRVEEQWTPEWQLLLDQSRTEIENGMKSHLQSAYKQLSKFRFFSFLVITLASITLVAVVVYPCERDETGSYVLVILSSLNLFCNTVITQLNLARNTERHFEYEVRYKELLRDIDYQLARGPRYRIPADNFMTYVKERLKLLDLGPPEPRSKWVFC